MHMRSSGSSGLVLSSLALGTLTWGRDTDPLDAADMLRLFVDAGGTAVEIAPTHGEGLAVDVMAEAVAPLGRHRVTILWRGGARLDSASRWHASASRSDMIARLDDALARLGTDHVDVWFAQPDGRVPLEETLEALDFAWRTGRAHYVGVDSVDAWTLGWAQARSGAAGAAPLVAVEQDLSLMTASRTHAVRGRLRAEGVGVVARSPLAGGVLTGKYRHSTPPDSRAASPHLRHTVEPHLVAAKAGVVEAVVRAAEGLDRAPADVALSWVRDAPGVASAVVGPRTVRQLEQILDFGEEPLPPQIRSVLDEIALSV